MKKTHVFKYSLWLAAFLSCAVAQGVQAEDRPTTIALSPYMGAIWSFEATVKDKSETFLLDTAGGITVITPQTAAVLGCDPWGQLTGFRMRGDRIDMQRCDDLTFTAGGAQLITPTAGVWDFANVLPKDAPPLAGSIALDSFAGRIITLDLAHLQLVIETPESARSRMASGKEVRMRLSRDVAGLSLTPFVAVKTARGAIWMELDSGSDAPVVIGAHNAELLGLKADVLTPQSLHAELAGGVPLDTPAARVMPMIIDGNLGAPVLTQWLVTLDLAQGRAWIAPAKP